MAAMFKIALWATTHQPIVRFQVNFVRGSRMVCRQRLHDQKLPISKIQCGRQPQFRKSLNHHISVKNRPILMKFGLLQQIMNLMTVT